MLCMGIYTPTIAKLPQKASEMISGMPFYTEVPHVCNPLSVVCNRTGKLRPGKLRPGNAVIRLKVKH